MPDGGPLEQRESLAGARNALLCCVLLLPALGFVWALFEPIVPGATLRRLGPVVLGSSAALLGYCAALLLVRPDAPAQRCWWRRAGGVLSLGWASAIAGAVVLLLPSASEQLRIIVTVFLGAMLVAQTTWTFTGLAIVFASQLLVLGSVAFVLLRGEAPYGGSVLIVLGLFGLLLMFCATGLRRLLRRTVVSELAVQRTAAEREAALQQAVQERNAKTRFLAATTHDLRQPLQAAVLFFERLLHPREPGEVPRAAQGLHQAFAAMDALLEQILQFLRLETGAITVRAKPVAAGDVFRHLCALHAPTAESAGLVLRAARTRLCVQADSELLERALANLLVNAVRHSCGERVLLAARRDGDAVRLYVLDDGVGIAPTEREQIWLEYVQGSAASARSCSGVGLGLATTRRLAELMGGVAALEPAWKLGAAFYLSLPVAEPASC